MMIRKLVSTLVIAGMFYWAPSVLPAIKMNPQTEAYACSTGNNYHAMDTAFAGCVTTYAAGSSATHAWPVVVMIAGVASIMFNAAIVWNTQCRELTLEEALTAGALPGVGVAINQSKGPKSACKH